MTAQFEERLRYRGRNLLMCTEPLEDYFEMHGIERPFAPNCSALWRGYVGRWKIARGRLYLVELLDGMLEDGTDATLASVFPEAVGPVFAEWYSGTLRVLQGKLLEYVHMGYASTYERDLFIEVERGVVKGTRIVDNGTVEGEPAPGHPGLHG